MCQNVSKEFLSVASENQAKTHDCSEGCVHGEGTENEGLRNLGHSMSKVLDTKKSVFGSQQWFLI